MQYKFPASPEVVHSNVVVVQVYFSYTPFEHVSGHTSWQLWKMQIIFSFTFAEITIIRIIIITPCLGLRSPPPPPGIGTPPPRLGLGYPRTPPPPRTGVPSWPGLGYLPRKDLGPDIWGKNLGLGTPPPPWCGWKTLPVKTLPSPSFGCGRLQIKTS